jgi:NAD(P)-dependent dehydrogenase (short-subunit alcohol dehydrogenase family)
MSENERKKILDTFKLDGKVAVVTGAAGLYSRQIVETLAEAGAKVFAADYDIEKLGSKMVEFEKAGLDVVALKFDQSSEESIDVLFDEIIAQSGQVDILVNSAVTRPMKDWDSPAEDFARSMAVNATGMFMIIRKFGDYMAEQGGGSIVNIGSIHGMIAPDYTLYEGLGWGMPADYFFHKGGLLQLTRFAASKFGPKGVRVNVVSPGGFFNNQGDCFVERYNARTFLGRMGNEQDLKGAIVFLASDASQYITGANIVVDGGYTVK